MNYNPYYFTPYMSAPKTGLFSSLFKGIGGIKWSGILNGTQKVLNIANQTLPMIKQVSPMVKNAKTMFKVMNEFKKGDANVSSANESNNSTNTSNTTTTSTNNIVNNEIRNSVSGPTFFL